MNLNYDRYYACSISYVVLLNILLLLSFTQSAFSQTVGGVDLSKIPGLENFTEFRNAPPEAVDNGEQDANNAPPEAVDNGEQDANNAPPEAVDNGEQDANNAPPEAVDNGEQDANNAPPVLDDAPDESNSNQIRIAFSGTVTQVDDRMNLLYGNVKVGTPITGEYIYRLSTKDTNTDQTVGDYPHDRRAFGITVNAGGLVFKTDPKNVNFLVEIVNRDSDHYLIRSYNNLPISDTVSVDHISWQLDDETGVALSNDSLKSAPVPPILQNWKDLFGLTITGEGPERGPIDSFHIRAHIDSVNLVS